MLWWPGIHITRLQTMTTDWNTRVLYNITYSYS
jgi:hypothetical protein